jgi:hypothetical protein
MKISTIGLYPKPLSRFYIDCYGALVDRYQKCNACDGSGQVHSHNSLCWDCHGTGFLTSKDRTYGRPREVEDNEKEFISCISTMVTHEKT